MTMKKKCNSESNSFVAASEQVCLQPVLIPKTSDLGDRHFIIRSLYKNSYWWDLRNQTCMSIHLSPYHFIVCIMCMNLVHTVTFNNCRYRYWYLQFVAIAFYCIYMCMNFVHSCVWQLFLKNKKEMMRWIWTTRIPWTSPLTAFV